MTLVSQRQDLRENIQWKLDITDNQYTNILFTFCIYTIIYSYVCVFIFTNKDRARAWVYVCLFQNSLLAQLWHVHARVIHNSATITTSCVSYSRLTSHSKGPRLCVPVMLRFKCPTPILLMPCILSWRILMCTQGRWWSNA